MINTRVILIDDERLAREELRRMLRAFPQINVVGEAGTIADAAEAIRVHQPDLLFLDIELPGATGFDLLEQLNPVPAVIFVTAYDQYAVQAFEAQALDYVMKPVRPERLEQVIRQALVRLDANPSPQRLFIRDGVRHHWIPLETISWIESADNYARLHFDGKTALIKRSLNQLEKQLAPAGFFRANRSQLIQTDFVSEIRPGADGRLSLTLRDGTMIDVSERQSVKFKALTRL